MKKIFVLLSVLSLVTWVVSFLATNYTPVVNVFLLLSVLFFIRSVMAVDMPPKGTMTVESPGLESLRSEQ